MLLSDIHDQVFAFDPVLDEIMDLYDDFNWYERREAAHQEWLIQNERDCL